MDLFGNHAKAAGKLNQPVRYVRREYGATSALLERGTHGIEHCETLRRIVESITRMGEIITLYREDIGDEPCKRGHIGGARLHARSAPQPLFQKLDRLGGNVDGRHAAARAYGLRKRNRLCSTAAADIENVFAPRHFQSLQQPAIKIDRGICAIDLDAFFEKLCLRSPLRSILIVASSHVFIS